MEIASWYPRLKLLLYSPFDHQNSWISYPFSCRFWCISTHLAQARGQVTAAEDIIDEDNCAGERDEDIARDDRDEDLATASEVDSDDDSDEENDLEFLITEDEGMDATEEDEIEIIWVIIAYTYPIISSLKMWSYLSFRVVIYVVKHPKRGTLFA